MQYLCVYVEGNDLEDCEEILVSHFAQLAIAWSGQGAVLVNERALADDPTLRDGQLKDWYLGIEMPLGTFDRTHAEVLVSFGADLAQKSGREFIVGIVQGAGTVDDIHYLGAQAGDRDVDFLTEHLAGP